MKLGRGLNVFRCFVCVTGVGALGFGVAACSKETPPPVDRCGIAGAACCPGLLCEGAACCVDNTCVADGYACGDDGSVCNAGACEASAACGQSEGQSCCDAGTECTTGLICDSARYCVSCGDVGQPCCEGSVCSVSGVECQAGECQSCGAALEACCEGNACDGGGCCLNAVCTGNGETCPAPAPAGSLCIDSGCSGCGLLGDPCCGTQCTQVGTVCHDNACATCGGYDQPCCSDGGCTEVGATCEAGTCKLSTTTDRRSCRAGPLATSRFYYVLLISIDGWNTVHTDELLAQGKLPSLQRLQNEGAWTHNARSDFTKTATLPCHTTMFTGRPVGQPPTLSDTVPHLYTSDGTPEAGVTVHTANPKVGGYLQSVFDVSHDWGRRVGFFGGKTKFSLFQESWATQGGPDNVGVDNGHNKLDVVQIVNGDAASCIATIVAAMQQPSFNLVFLHMAEADLAGDQSGFESQAYLDALVEIDGYLGQLLAMIDNSPKLNGHTAIVLTADHGGTGSGHSDASEPLNFRIPFYVWGAGIPGNVDLYSLASCSRGALNESVNIECSAGVQPIRNGDASDITLRFLGLPAISGAVMTNLGQ